MFVLWPRMWSILVHVPWALEKNVYFAILGRTVLQMLIRFCCLMVLLTSSISLLVFCLVVLSIIEREVLKFPVIIVDLSIFPFPSICFCYTYFAVLLFDT